MADTPIWQELVGTIMQAADAYAKAYHKWHGEDPEEGDHDRMASARTAVHNAALRATDGVRACVNCGRSDGTHHLSCAHWIPEPERVSVGAFFGLTPYPDRKTGVEIQTPKNPAGVNACPAAQDMGGNWCGDRSQCMEHCGTAGVKEDAK